MAKIKSHLPGQQISSFERKLKILTPVILTTFNIISASLISNERSNNIAIIKIEEIYSRNLTPAELKSNIFIRGLDGKLYPLTLFIRNRGK